MKGGIVILLILFAQLLTAQNTSYSGTLINKETQKPIFGATISVNNRMITFSDEAGKFQFEFAKAKKDSYVQIAHQSYETDSILLKKLVKKEVTIRLVEKFENLDEIVIKASLDLTKKEIVKRAVKTFGESNRKKSYWSSINYKQTLLHQGTAQAYYEMEGHALMVGENNYIFSKPLVIPDQIRRTREHQQVTNLMKWEANKDHLKVSHFIARGNLISFRCFEVFHPLRKNKKRLFDFKIEKIEEINDRKYYVIHYKAKNRIYENRRFNRVNGQLWIDKEDFTLYKSTVGFDFDRIHYEYLQVQYEQYDGVIYPVEIYNEEYRYKNNKNQDISNVIIKRLSTFDTIDFEERGHYKGLDLFMAGYITADVYNQDYWAQRPIDNESFESDVSEIIGKEDWHAHFASGAKEIQYQKGSSTEEAIQMTQKRNSELVEKMKKEWKF
jgi:flagellar basal body-associated protein FliL